MHYNTHRETGFTQTDAYICTDSFTLTESGGWGAGGGGRQTDKQRGFSRSDNKKERTKKKQERLERGRVETEERERQ